MSTASPNEVAQEPAAASTETPPPKSQVVPPEHRLQYFAAFRYVFASPKWIDTLALGSLCYFIPVFGQLALLGFVYEIVERLHRDPTAPCPAFDFHRFTRYCRRGVWAFLLLWAVMSILQPALQIPLQYSVFGIMIAFQSSANTGAIVSAILAAVWLCVFALIWTLWILILQPLSLRAGLSQDLGATFKLSWVFRYARLMWLELLLVNALVTAAMFVLLPLGLLMMLVGVLPVSIWITVAGAHLAAQVYQIYLARGGEPVPLRPQEAELPPVAVGESAAPSEQAPII